MKIRMRCVILVSAALMPVTAVSAVASMKEGLWEITTTMEMPGMPYQPPASVYRHCYTREDLKDEKQVLPKQQGDCRVTDMKRDGSRMTWKIVCSGENKGKGEGEITFRGDSAYDGSMNIEMNEMKMTGRYKARRVGACP
jgi:Protein of unknown function (DUF3617)